MIREDLELAHLVPCQMLVMSKYSNNEQLATGCVGYLHTDTNLYIEITNALDSAPNEVWFS